MADIEELLKQGKTIQIKPKGVSMYPLIVPGRDEVIIEPIEDVNSLKRGDIVLYRREGSILVLHRICKVRSNGIYFVGDNQEIVEGPISFGQVRGRLTVFIRKGKRFSSNNIIYKFFAGVWLFLRPIRRYIKVPAAHVKNIFIRKK